MDLYTFIPFEKMILDGCEDFCDEALACFYCLEFDYQVGTNTEEQLRFIKKNKDIFNDIHSRANRRNINKLFIENGYSLMTSYDMSKLLQNLYELYTGNHRFTNIKWLDDTKDIFKFIKSNVSITTKYNINEQQATLHSIIRLLKVVGRHDLVCEYKNMRLDDYIQEKDKRKTRRLNRKILKSLRA